MNLEETCYNIMVNIYSWVEVNRLVRPAFVKENFLSVFLQACKPLKQIRGKEIPYTWTWERKFIGENIYYRFDEQGKIEDLYIKNSVDESCKLIMDINTYLNKAKFLISTKGF